MRDGVNTGGVDHMHGQIFPAGVGRGLRIQLYDRSRYTVFQELIGYPLPGRAETDDKGLGAEGRPRGGHGIHVRRLRSFSEKRLNPPCQRQGKRHHVWRQKHRQDGHRDDQVERPLRDNPPSMGFGGQHERKLTDLCQGNTCGQGRPGADTKQHTDAENDKPLKDEHNSQPEKRLRPV